MATELNLNAAQAHVRQGACGLTQCVLDMQAAGEQYIASRQQAPAAFKMGFHSIPSMTQLHMHVISQVSKAAAAVKAGLALVAMRFALA